MMIDPSLLLKKLEPVVRPAAAPPTGRRPDGPLEAQSFDHLLSLVSTGSVHSGRAVTVGPEAGLEKELTDGQHERLAAAADRAEAAGATRAVMLIDGRGLVMSVPDRQVTAELSTRSTEPLTTIDAAVYVAGEDEVIDHARFSGSILPSAMMPAAVARQLAEADASRSHSDSRTQSTPANEPPPAPPNPRRVA